MGQTNYSVGHEAEKRAAVYLEHHGFEVVELNWKTRVCEVDVVAKKHNIMYFVEVKFRRNSNQGTGLEYITPKKLRQMSFAAEVWVQENDWNGAYELAAIELTGVAFTVTNFLPSIG